MLRLSTRTLEAIIVGGGAILLLTAAQSPEHHDPMMATVALADALAKASPSAIMATFLVILWRRYTAREDAHTALTRDAIQTMQEVRDSLRNCPNNRNTGG